MSVLPTIRLKGFERDVVLLTASGKTARQIGKMTGRTDRGVEGIKVRLIQKFNARSFYQVIADCFRLNLID